MQPLLVDVELHAEDEVGVLDHGVGDEEGHRGERGEPVHLPDGDEHERDAGDDEQRVRRNFVRAALKHWGWFEEAGTVQAGRQGTVQHVVYYFLGVPLLPLRPHLKRLEKNREGVTSQSEATKCSPLAEWSSRRTLLPTEMVRNQI